MDITVLGGNAFSVYITNDYLIENSLTPASIGFDDLLSLLPSRVPDPVIELFAGRGGVIAFIRSSDERKYYAFSSLDALIEASGSVSVPDSELWLYGGEYILAVPQRENLDDYGRRVSLEREYAECIIKSGAVSLLRHIFLQNSL